MDTGVPDGVRHRCDARREGVEDGILQSLPGPCRTGSPDGIHPGGRGRGDGDGPHPSIPGGCALSQACTRADLRAERLSRMTGTSASGSGPAAP